jgi:hypothetical protein
MSEWVEPNNEEEYLIRIESGDPFEIQNGCDYYQVHGLREEDVDRVENVFWKLTDKKAREDLTRILTTAGVNGCLGSLINIYHNCNERDMAHYVEDIIIELVHDNPSRWDCLPQMIKDHLIGI